MTTQAIILAAGRGSRLGEVTGRTPKPLIPVAGRPIIVHQLDGLLQAGIRSVAIVTGYLGHEIETELGNGSVAAATITYFRQEELNGSAKALELAREFADNEPFIFSWGDILVEPANYQRVVQASRFTGAAIAVNPVDDPAEGAAVYVDDPSGDGDVTNIVEKPAPGTSETPWNNAGLGVLPPAIWPIIEKLEPSERGEYDLTDAIATLVKNGRRVRAVPVEGPWFDIGTPENLKEARRTFGGRP